jgi:hypothetical protein
MQYTLIILDEKHNIINRITSLTGEMTHYFKLKRSRKIDLKKRDKELVNGKQQRIKYQERSKESRQQKIPINSVPGDAEDAQ